MIKNVLEWLEVNKDSKRVVYKDENSQITFDEVINISKCIGSSLLNVYETNPIAVISGRNISTIYTYLGIVYSGHAYAPIDGSLPRNRINSIIEILQPSAIVADVDNYNLARELSDNVFLMDELIGGQVNEDGLQKVRNCMVMTDPLYVIFTSGSTGVPKGVITSHQSLICYIQSYVEVMQINKKDVLGNQSPLDYIAAIRDIYVPLFTGCSTVIIPKSYFSQPDILFGFLNKNKITVVGWSVSALTVPISLKTFGEVQLTTLRKICFSGSVMSASVLREWQNNLPNALFVNQYGPTEATASCTYYVVDHKVELDEKLLIGRPYTNYKVFLLNDDLSPTVDGEVGEICVSGPILALGYYGDSERTEKSFVNNPNTKSYPERMYRTGDYGRINSDGLLEFHGRMDRQIKLMGHRVELDEIEVVVNSIEEVVECAVLYDAEKERIHLFYSGNIDKREVIIKLRENLPDYMIPRKIKNMDSIPKLANGKIDLSFLKESI